MTFLGLGCRIKSGLGTCHLMMGTPGALFLMMYENIRKLEKPIGMLKKARQKT